MCIAKTTDEPRRPVRPDEWAFEVAVKAWLEQNRMSASPWPVCPDCGIPFGEGDAGNVDPSTCLSCETRRHEDLVAGLVSSSPAEILAALRDLIRLRRAVRQ